MQIILISLFILLFSSRLSSLENDRLISQYFVEHWTIEEGLPQNSITSIVQNNDCFVLFGTQNGVVKYDGKEFNLVLKSDYLTIKNNYIVSLLSDSEDFLWIGTKYNGLYKYKNKIIAHYSKFNGLADDGVKLISELNGNILIGTFKGLNKISKVGLDIIESVDKNIELFDQNINSILIDSSNTMWIGTSNGIKAFSNYNILTYTKKDGLLSDIITSCCEKDNNIFISSRNGGINILNKTNSKITEYKQPYKNISLLFKDSNDNIWYGTMEGLTRMGEDEKTMFFSFVISIFEDNENNIWVGTSANGLYKLSYSKFIPYSISEGLSNSCVRSIFEDSHGVIWIGTDKGINCIKGNKVFHLFKESKELKAESIQSICEDINGTIWLGTPNGIFEIKNENYFKYSQKNGLSCENIYTIFKDSHNIMWVGTTHGIFKYINNKFTSFEFASKIRDPFIHIFFEDEKYMWIGTRRGLYCCNENECKQYNFEKRLENVAFLSIFKSRKGEMWFGTNGEGLTKISEDKNYYYNSNDGLPDNTIFSIFEDDKNNLWFSSNNGIFCLNITDFERYDRKEISILPVKKYDTSDGLPSKECNGGTQPCAIKDKNNNLWFATVKGTAKINPNNIKTNLHIPKVYIEKMLVNGENCALNQKIEVEYDQNKYEFNYVALSYQNTQKVFYKYRLIGFDKDFVYAGNKRTAHYTSLQPGDYMFKVIACNNDGLWNEIGDSLTFTILKPFYETYWFYGLVLIGLSFCFYGSLVLRTRRIKKNESNLKKLIDIRTKELLDANEAKSKFLANMSHDLRTPITVIKSYCQIILMKKKVDEETRGFLVTMNESITSLTKIVSEIFEVSKIELGKIEINKSYIDIPELVRSIDNQLLPIAQLKNLELNYCLCQDFPNEIFTDRTKLEQILMNLLTNSIKFTKEGSISLSVSSINENKDILFSISDTGIGIPAENLPQIYNPFFRSKQVEKSRYDGVGLGLSIVKSFVELLGGKIWVESIIDKGTVFYFTIPNESFLIHENVDNSISDIDNRAFHPEKYCILLVEDDENIAKSILELFEINGYNYLIATTGKEAIDKVHNNSVDLVIMDIQLPEMSGDKAIKEIRKNNTEIQIIASTAFNLKGDKEKFLEMGFNDFISKPFDLIDLNDKIKKYLLISSKKNKNNDK